MALPKQVIPKQVIPLQKIDGIIIHRCNNFPLPGARAQVKVDGTFFKKISRNPSEKEDLENEAMILKYLQNKPSAFFPILIEFDAPKNGPAILSIKSICGTDLQRLIHYYRNLQKPIPEELLLSIIGQLLLGVVHLHSKGIGHRDIKPGNIMITDYGHVKIVDFGNATQDLISTKDCGTPNYAAPELMQCLKYNPIMCDIWSLGVTFYELLVLNIPYNYKTLLHYCVTGRTDNEIDAEIDIIINRIPDLVPKYSDKCPTSVANIQELIRLMLRTKPSKRSTAKELLNIFEENYQIKL